VYCSTSHRQAAWRFQRGRIVAARTAAPMRFAYLDPPYPGMADLYVDHPDYGGEVDHERLVAAAVGFFPDGWALSTSAAALPEILELVIRAVGPGSRRRVRVCAWFRDVGRNGRGGTRAALLNAWEPVIVVGGRRDPSRLQEHLRLDALEARPRARTTDPGHVVGAKPARFWWWLFDLLGAQPGDQFVDYFTGSGGGDRAWQLFSEERAAA
jgi:hypothetical protein